MLGYVEMEEKNKNLSRNVIIGISGTVINKVISFVTIIIVGYIMTAEIYGNLSIYTTVLSIIAVFVGLQLNGSLQNALLKYDNKEYDSYCSSILLISMMSAILIAIPVCSFAYQLGEIFNISYILIYCIVPQCYGAFLVGFMTTYFLSKKEVLKNLIWSFLYALLLSCTSLLLAYLMTNKALGYVIGQCGVNILMGIIVLVILFLRGGFKINVDYVKFAVKFSLPLIMHMLGTIIMGQSDKLMISFLMDETSVGEYSMIHNYAMLVNALWGAINSVFIPYYYDDLKRGDKKIIRKRCLEYYIFFGIISFAFMFVGKEIIGLIVNEEYHNGLVVFPMSVLSQFFVFVYSFSVNYEFYKQKTIWIAIGTLLSAVINIGLNIFMIQQWGIYGAALASAISYAFLVLFHELISKFVVKDYPIDFWFMILAILGGFLLTFVCQWLDSFWYIRWLFAGLIGVVLFFKILKTKRIF